MQETAFDASAAAVFGDEPEMATWASDMKRTTAVRHYTIRRAADGELLALAHLLWVWVDSGGWATDSGAGRVPGGFRA